jgi:hypothetical protein
MSYLKENGMSNGEALAAVNKIHNQKSRNLKTFQVFPVQNKFFNAYLIFKVEHQTRNKVNVPEPRCA